MYTVTELAKQCDVSRTTVLYYEREGLLKPATRSHSGYRYYGEKELKRLQSIVRFRSFGIAVADIGALIDHEDDVRQSEILRAQFEKLEHSIADLRKQQSAIVTMLQQPELLEKKMVTKDRWVQIMKASGFSESDMISWHQNFEIMEPTEHQLFLESLGISAQEIKRIRQL